MAKLHIPPGYGLVAFKSTSATGHHCVSEIGTSWTSTLSQSAVDTLSTAVGPKYANCHTSPGGYSGLTLTYRDVSNDLRQFTSIAGAATSGRTGTNMTPQVCFLIAKKTGLVGRRFRGRFYIGDVRESDADDGGTLTVPTTTTLQDLATQIMTSLATAPFSGPVLLHSDTTTPPTPLSSFTASNRVATQRRRYKR